MNRVLLALIATAFVTTAFAGCMEDEPPQAVIPLAIVQVTPIEDSGDVVDTYLFDASASEGMGIRFDWSLGDGTQSDQPTITHTYVYGTGTYPVRLLLTDMHGITDLWTTEIVVGTGKNLPPVAYFSPSTRYLEIGEPLTVDARATYDPEDDPIVYQWDFNHRMDTEGYYHFRENKKAGREVSESDQDDAVVSNGKSGALPEAIERAIDTLPLHKHVPDEGAEPPQSLFDGRRSSNEQVFTLQEGFPDATRFFVRLVAIDVKGASERIVSEEVWPVLVVDSKMPSHYMDETTGTFTFGASGQVTDTLPEDEDSPYQTKRTWTFEIPDPIADLGTNETGALTHSMWINATWSQHVVYDSTEQLPNLIQMTIVPPTGDPIPIEGGGTWIQQGLTGADGYGSGVWQIRLQARQGVDIDYTVSYWAMVEQNPFREIEAQFL